MNRSGLKQASKKCLQDAGNTKWITLVFLLAIVTLALVEWGSGVLVEKLNTRGQYLSDMLSASSRDYIIVAVVSFLCQLAGALLWFGYASFALRLSRGRVFSMDTLLDGFRIWNRGILLYVYTALLESLWAGIFSIPVTYLVTALISGGVVSEDLGLGLLMGYMTIALWLVSYRYRMCSFLLLDHPEYTTRQIVSEAKAINQVHRFRLFVLDLSFVPWFLLCALTGGILLIWKLPYITATYAHAYNFMLDDYEKRKQRLQDLIDQHPNGL